MTAPTPGPTPEPTTKGKGYKYHMIDAVLRATVAGAPPLDQWISERRRAKPQWSYSSIAEELNRIVRSGDNVNIERVTHESIRRWDPDGVFLHDWAAE